MGQQLPLEVVGANKLEANGFGHGRDHRLGVGQRGQRNQVDAPPCGRGVFGLCQPILEG